MADLQLRNLYKSFGAATAAVDDVSLDLRSGEFVTLLGPSGCGKTTTLRIVAGLEKPDRGEVHLGGAHVTALPPFRRNIGMVFQSHALFPHMTVAENVAFGLRMRKVDARERRERVKSTLDLVRLGDFLQRYPHQLSGGQQQRVALARALVVSPDILLLDEPFGALDRKLRETLQEELRVLTREIGITSLFVTHDQEEALILSDRICVMNTGKIEQVGTPQEVFEHPATHFVADFMGVGNFMPATIESTAGGETIASADGVQIVAQGYDFSAGDKVNAAIRAEKIELLTEDPGDQANVAAGHLVHAIYQGANSNYRVNCSAASHDLTVRAGNAGAAQLGALEPGQAVWLRWPASAVRLLARD